MKKTKKIFAFVLALILIFSVIPIIVSAAETSGKCGDNVFWSYDNKTKTLTISGTGDMYSYRNNTLTPWANHKYMEVVDIKDGVTSIGSSAFGKKTYLKNVSIPDSVKSIGGGVFDSCDSLESLTIPLSVTRIGGGVFPLKAKIYYHGTKEQWQNMEKESGGVNFYLRAYCSDGEVLPSGVYGDNVIWTFDIECGLLTISGTGDMHDGKVNSSPPWFEIDDLITDVYIEDGVTSIGDRTFVFHRSLKNIHIPDSVTKIGAVAFWDCLNLTNITIPDGVTKIGDEAFRGCTGLTDITIPVSVTEIENYAFPYSATIHYQGTKEQWQNLQKENNQYLFGYYVCCSDGELLPTGTCGDNLTWAFDKSTGTLTISGTGEMYNYSVHVDEYDRVSVDSPWYKIKDLIKNVNIEDTVTSIGDYAFYECENLEEIKVSNNLTYIGKCAFKKCSALKNFTIPEIVTKICGAAFSECSSLESIIIPDSVTEMGGSAFFWCKSLKSVVIGDGVTIIEGDTFSGCENLEKVTHGKSVKTIGRSAFEDCTNLSEMRVHPSLEQVNESAFMRSRKMTVYHSGTKEDLRKIKVEEKNNSRFCVSDFRFDNGEIAGLYGKDSIWYYDEATSTVTISGSGEGYNLTFPYTNSSGYSFLKPKNVVIEDGAQKISSCSSEDVQTVVVPESVKEIQQGAFSGCSNLSIVYYFGSREQWNEIAIDPKYNDPLMNAQIVYNACMHNYTGTSFEATCTQHGYTKYTCEDCGYYYNDYTANPTGHNINADGVCENCGKQETVNNTASNNQLLSFDSILQLIINLMNKIFDAILVGI